ncbi:MAG TPA: HD domain-containing phosphohydrolase [Patescibacteria group bacterium]|nr:HD domain-containing phosphohydrolase [Patescibacteria group bacterium]
MDAGILIVDDDPNVVEILTESLRSRGYRTESALNGEEALEKYDRFEPDLVLLDVVLPKKDGFQVCDEIRTRDIHRDVPIIMISSSSIRDTVVQGYRSGAQDYVKKPFSLSEIHAKIDTYLSQAHSCKDLREQKIVLEGEVQKGQEDYLRVNRELKKKILDMRSLFGLSQDLNRLRDPDDLVHIFSLTIIGQIGINAVALFYVSNELDEHLSFAGGKGMRFNVLRTVRLSREVGLSKYAIANQDMISLGNKSLTGDARREADFMAEFGFAYCFPLIVKSQLIGIVFVGEKVSDQPYSEHDFDLLKSICNSAATGFENSRLYLELQSTYLSTIKVLVSTIEAKDSYTRGHTERVAEYARMLADEIGLSKRDKEIVSFGAALHDIGKLGVYEDILNKPGDLTENEWVIVRSHPEVGAKIIQNMKFLKSACDLVRHHHERLDGKGYPDGLRGDEISIGARIVAVADSFDAMTSDRPYRKAYSIDTAISKLKFQGEKFDVGIVDRLEKLIRIGKIKK